MLYLFEWDSVPSAIPRLVELCRQGEARNKSDAVLVACLVSFLFSVDSLKGLKLELTDQYWVRPLRCSGKVSASGMGHKIQSLLSQVESFHSVEIGTL